MSKKPNKAGQYKIANEKFLEANAQEEGVKVLESGIILRQIEAGTGDKCPTLNSIVFVNYTRMHVGDKYEIFIPAKYGYGSMKMDGIPAHSTLIFTLELLKIQ